MVDYLGGPDAMILEYLAFPLRRSNMSTPEPSADDTGQWMRIELLKDAIPLLLPVSSALGGSLFFAIPGGSAILAKLAGLLPAPLVALWSEAIIPGWIVLTIGCSAATVFRYALAVANSRMGLAFACVFFVPLLCLGHWFATLLGGYLLGNLFGERMQF